MPTTTFLSEDLGDKTLTARKSTTPIPLLYSEITFDWSTETFRFPFTHLETLSTGVTLLKLVPTVTMELSFH